MTTIRFANTCALGFLAAALAAGCASRMPASAELEVGCLALAGRAIAAASIGLPSGDAVIASATLVGPSAGPPAVPAHCRVLGSIAPRGTAAQHIQFQINLPTQAWNGKALQYGGGGFNGTLITGMAPLRDAAPSDALPIARGYLTYGTDSGHQASAWPASEPGAFALDEEMLANFAFASYKKVRDVAVAVSQVFYGRAPQRVYYFGGSEGGREGLMMAQRFPSDYDGIVSVVPVLNWTGLFHAFVRNQRPQFGDWLPPTKTPLVALAVNEACDALDGLADGVVNHWQACQGRVDLQPLRCPGGKDSGATCLSDGQIRALQAVHTPYRFSFALANGIDSYPPWLWGHEDSLDGATALNLVRWVGGSAAPAVPPDAAANATQWLYGSNWIRYAIARDAAFDVRNYEPAAFQARVQHTSALIDATDPNLAPFFARGGKLIVRENTADRAQSALMGIGYHQAVVARLGAPAVEGAMRLYVSPASTHTGNGRSVLDQAPVPTMVDLLDPLDRWVTAGQAPADVLVQSDRAAAPPFAVRASRPMCRYPGYPRYVGGDRLRAESYVCTTAQL